VKALELATWAPMLESTGMEVLDCLQQGTDTENGDAVIAKTELMASWPEAKQFERPWQGGGRIRLLRRAPVCIAVLMGNIPALPTRFCRPGRDGSMARGSAPAGDRKSACRAQPRHRIHLSFSALPRAGSTWMGGPLQAKKEIEQLLGVPPEWILWSDSVGITELRRRVSGSQSRM